MLQGLRISNLAVIEEAELTLGPGLTVMTGETGAGKSILVDALGLLSGGRADATAVRAGCEEGSVEGLLRRTDALASRLSELGLPDLGEELSVRRVIGSTGRGKAYVNGALVTVGVLARLMHGLVDIAGQHEHMSLFDPALHLGLVDAFGELDAGRSAFRAEHQALRDLELEAQALGTDALTAAGRMDFLRFQLDELEKLAPIDGEDEALEQDRRRLGGAERLRHGAAQVEQLLCAQDGAALETTGRAIALVTEAAKLDPTLATIQQSLEAARAELDEASRAVGRYIGSLESDPHRLSEVEDRLDALKRLCRKHGTSLKGVLEKRDGLIEELGRLSNRQAQLDALDSRRALLRERAWAAARELSALRVRAARAFEQGVRAGLRELAMPKALFEVQVRLTEVLHSNGADALEFFFSANVGEPVRPLAKVASGGEASRVVLALRRALARHDGCACYVLDEADAGVGGAVAEGVGRMIKEVSRHRQVLCITHLPQVAAFADSHWVISKGQRRGRTHSSVVELTRANERAKELGRMLSGVEVTREALLAAESLMRSALRTVEGQKPAVRKPKAETAERRPRRSA